MMFFKKSNKIQNSIDTLIGAETRINGNIHFKGGLRIDGTVYGNVTEPNTSSSTLMLAEANANPSTLILSEYGRIEGALNVSKIVINGKVIGSVNAGQFIELQAKAHVTGDVYYKSLEMHPGAVIEGKLEYLGEISQTQQSETE